MYISGSTAALNLGLNLLLIPNYGISGAALATAGSLVLNNILQLGYIYRIMGIQPFNLKLILPSVLALVCLGSVNQFLLNTTPGFLGAFATASALGVAFVFCILLTRSVYVGELKLVDSLVAGIGINLRLEQRLKTFTEGW